MNREEQFRKELEDLINKYSMENYCNLSDYELSHKIVYMIINNEFKEIERLNKELEIYKLRHKLALKKLNSAMKHYDLEDKNNTIKFCKEILEGKGIEEKCHKKLRGDKE